MKQRIPKRVWFYVVAIPVVVALAIVASSLLSRLSKTTDKFHTVVYTVGGTAGSADITYYSSNGFGATQSLSAGQQKLPWTKTIMVKGNYSGFDVMAKTSKDPDSKSGTLMCAITVDGKQASQDAASGAGASVSCDGNSSQGK
jgi:hypothetical protein